MCKFSNEAIQINKSSKQDKMSSIDVKKNPDMMVEAFSVKHGQSVYYRG